jgi:hypothetical protein
MTDIGERSIGAVLKDIVGNVQQIIRAELRLARAEVGQEARKAKRSLMLLLVGGVIAALSLGCLLLAGVYALSIVVAPWLAALIVGAATAGLGAAFVAAGMKQMTHVTLPPRTAAAIEENLQWTKAPTK